MLTNSLVGEITYLNVVSQEVIRRPRQEIIHYSHRPVHMMAGKIIG